MDEKDINVLTGLKTAKVALVNRGANQRPRFPITKSEDPIMDEAVLKAILEVEAEGEDKLESVCKDMGDKGATAMRAAMRLLSAFADELPKDTIAKLADLTGMEAPVAKAEKKNPFDDMTDEEKKAMKKKEKAEAEARAAKARAAKESGSVAKALASLPDDVRPAMEAILKAQEQEKEQAIAKAADAVAKAEAKAEEVAKALKVEKDARETEQWIAKSAEHLSHAPGKSTKEFGQMLKSLADVDPKLAETQFEALKAASDAIKQSELLKAAGSGGSFEPGSAEEKIEDLAKSLVQKGDSGLTIEQAKARVIESNPDLYNLYIAERNARG